MRRLILAFAFALASSAAWAAGEVLTLDDVLGESQIDSVAPSPDGEWLAVVVQRAVSPGEVYGRTYYETDPSRADVWIISQRTGQHRKLTDGAARAAGFWCATWSPDGNMLAMLSTESEGSEPRGGDNVRLYVWTRATQRLRRLSDRGVVTQPRYGSGMYRLDVRGPSTGEDTVRTCNGNENAPFSWIDNRHLLAIAEPLGGVSGLIDEYDRPVRQASDTAVAIRQGRLPTFTSVGSGRESQKSGVFARLVNIEARTGREFEIGSVPLYPFRGALSVSIAPDARQIAVLATSGTLPVRDSGISAPAGELWTVERRLGFADPRMAESLRWPALGPEARYPIELLAWAPGGSHVALRARAGSAESNTSLFAVSASSTQRVSPGGLTLDPARGASVASAEPEAVWVDERRLVARMRSAKTSEGGLPPRSDWWSLDSAGPAVNLTADLAVVPSQVRRLGNGSVVALQGDRLLVLKPGEQRFSQEEAIPGASHATFALPQSASEQVVLEWEGPEGTRIFLRTKPGAGAPPERVILPRSANLVAFDSSGALYWTEFTRRGLFLSRGSFRDSRTDRLLALNEHLAKAEWGTLQLIEYGSGAGGARKAAVILPPGYTHGKTYPTIVWVYPGHNVADVEDYLLAPDRPGIFNLHLYASRGYVIVVPSLPLAEGREGGKLLSAVAAGVELAVDRLIAMGITSRDRVGILGHSFGGFAAYGLAAATKRYGAIVAISGVTDLSLFYGQFDPTARGYPGIEHEKSFNWLVAPQFGLNGAPYRGDPDYLANSPAQRVGEVSTPLLMIHGEYDERASMTQAELFFYQLYQQGKTAKLLRYWGENHALARSPANVRSVFEETVAWFDKYLAEK